MRGHLRGNHGRSNFYGNFCGDFYGNFYAKEQQLARPGSVMPPLASAGNRNSGAEKRFAATNGLENTIVKVKQN
jgi:hypothetical protein